MALFFSGFLNVHLVPHSHDDVGWLKSIDEYFIGSKNDIARACVSCILDSVVDELSRDPARRFIQVETAFFWRWWRQQNGDIKQLVQQLVQEGRLEFVGGGWSMNDEAAAHYVSIIENMAMGFHELKELFGRVSFVHFYELLQGNFLVRRLWHS